MPEKLRAKAAEEYEHKRELYYQGVIPRSEVLEAERALADSITAVEEDKRRAIDADSELPFLAGASSKWYDDIKTWESKKTCWQELGRDGNSHEIKNVVLGGFILDVKAESIDKRLVHIFIVFPQGDYAQIVLTFKERYGVPTAIKTETVQSRIGAKFKNEILKWEGRRVTITLDKLGWTVDKGTISYDTDTWRDYTARKFRDEIKQKAKGL